MAFEIVIDDRKLRRDINRFAGEIPEVLERRMLRVLRNFRKEFVATRLNGRPGLKRETGKLIRSFKVTPITGPKKGRELSMVTDSVYAPIHELGGVISPRNGKFLAIPIGARRGTSPRDTPNGFFVKTSRGNLMYGTSNGDTFIPLFLLKETVTIPPRMGLLDMFKRHERQIVRDMQAAVNQAISRTFR